MFSQGNSLSPAASLARAPEELLCENIPIFLRSVLLMMYG